MKILLWAIVMLWSVMFVENLFRPIGRIAVGGAILLVIISFLDLIKHY